jgi:hypothetical protein
LGDYSEGSFLVESDEFWHVMEHFQWAHPFDSNGKRRELLAMPATPSKLSDDPYLSLAGELRLAGGYSKDSSPFSEFLWAGFLRRRVPEKDVLRRFSAAQETANALFLRKSALLTWLAWSS